MPTCREIAALATDYAEGHLAAADRTRFESHLTGCAGCAVFVEQLGTTARAVGALPEPELPIELRRQLLERFDGWASRRAGAEAPANRPVEKAGARWRSAGAALAALVAFGLLVALARKPSGAPGDWGIALALVGLAVALAALGRRVSFGSAAVAVGATLAAALLGGGPGQLDLHTGLECLLTLAAAAGGTAGAGWLVLRRGPGAAARSTVGAAAVAGALAGAAALQVTCGAHTSLPHLLAFHVGGVLCVAGIALLPPAARSRAA